VTIDAPNPAIFLLPNVEDEVLSKPETPNKVISPYSVVRVWRALSSSAEYSALELFIRGMTLKYSGSKLPVKAVRVNTLTG
jgi:hypothetical protein